MNYKKLLTKQSSKSFVIIFSIPVSAFSQTLKSYSGTFTDGRMGQNGTATYSYYEDEATHEYVKNGAFSYTFNGTGDYKGFNQTIKGNYKNGLKDGLWAYTLTFSDFNIENGLVMLAATNKYTTGKITLTANYKNGYAHGVWKTNWSYKKRSKDYYNREWLPFEAQKTLAIEMNFDSGYVVGKVSIKNDFSPFEATGNFDQNSLATGTWMVKDIGWNNSKELIYKDNILYEFIGRETSTGKINGQQKNQSVYEKYLEYKGLSPKEMEDKGIRIDTVYGSKCAAYNNIENYVSKFFNEDYFSCQFIDGDLSFKEGIKGGGEITILQLVHINELFSDEVKLYNRAEQSFNNKKYEDALTDYERVFDRNKNVLVKKDVDYLVNKIKECDSLIQLKNTQYEANKVFAMKFIASEETSISSFIKNFWINYEPTYSWLDYNKLLTPYYGSTPHPLDKSLYYDLNYLPKCHPKKGNCEFSLGKNSYREIRENQYGVVIGYQYFFNKEAEQLSNNLDIYFSVMNENLTKLQQQKIDTTVFISNVSESRNKWVESKNIFEKEFRFKAQNDSLKTEINNLRKAIIELNETAKSKLIFDKYNVVLSNLMDEMENQSSQEQKNIILQQIIKFQNEIKNLFENPSKDIEKQLKKTSTVQDILSVFGI